MAATQWQPLVALRSRHPAKARGLARAWRGVRPYLPPVNFITVHHAYFIFVGLLFAAIFWSLSDPDGRVSFVDSLFLVESAFTTSGLNTVNISELVTGQQVLLALLMIMGSPVVVSLFTIWFRAHIFEKRFEDIVEAERERGRQLRGQTGAIVGMAGTMSGMLVMSSFRERAKGAKPAAPSRRGTWTRARLADADAFQLGAPRPDWQTSQPASPSLLPPIQEARRWHVDEGVEQGARPQSASRASVVAALRSPFRSSDFPRPTTSDGGPGFDLEAFIEANKESIGRNGQFFALTDEDRAELGGREYRALRVLFVIVGVYFVVVQVLGGVALGAWMSARNADITAVNRQNPWWTGVFLCVSSFNNAGMTLLDAGIAAYNGDGFVLTVVTVLALAGNYAFPAFLRATVWSCRFVLTRTTAETECLVWKDALAFILRYPRRLFMLMFPARANWVFVGICTTLAVLNWVLLLVLSIGNPVLDVYPVGQRVGLALFQGITIPSGGFTVVSTSSLYPDVQVLWVIMMYLAAYPEIIVMRNSNVYEEQSLGLYTTPRDTKKDDELGGESTDRDTLPLTAHDTSRRASASGVSLAASTPSVKRLAAVGRRGTAFVGRQIQKRVSDFQGVGVTAPRRRATAEGRLSAQQEPADEGHVDLVTQHLRSQLSHDMWSIAMALFVISLIETSHSLAQPAAYTVFHFLFEIVSGYTNLGLSMGLPGASFSFSGGWYTGSKLVLILMMIRGRHRGLPVALDHAVKLPAGWPERVKRVGWKRAVEAAETRRRDENGEAGS